MLKECKSACIIVLLEEHDNGTVEVDWKLYGEESINPKLKQITCKLADDIEALTREALEEHYEPRKEQSND